MDIRQMLQQWSDVRKHLVELTYKEMNQLWYNDDSHVHCFDTVNDNLSALEKFSQHIIAHGWQRKNLNQARTEYLCTLFIVQTFQTNLKEYYIHDNISHINQRNPLHIGLNDYKKWKSQLTTEYIQHLKTCDKTEDTSWIYNTLKFGNNLNSLLQALTVICLNKVEYHLTIYIYIYPYITFWEQIKRCQNILNRAH